MGESGKCARPNPVPRVRVAFRRISEMTLEAGGWPIRSSSRLQLTQRLLEVTSRIKNSENDHRLFHYLKRFGSLGAQSQLLAIPV